MKKPTAKIIFLQLIQVLKLKIHKKDVIYELNKYYDNPNINEISNILNSWNIKNIIINNIPLENLSEAPLPILSFNKTDELFLITEIKNNTYTCFLNTSKKEVVLNTNDFLALTNGLYILLEANEYSGVLNREEKNNSIKGRINTNILILIGFVLVIAFGFFNIDNSSLFFYSLSLLGLVISIYLLLKEKSFFSNEIIDLCSIGTKFSCDKVISSNEGKILNVSLSEISTGFFLFLVLSTIYSYTVNVSIDFTYLFIYLSSISVIYSITQQIKMKLFCIMCLSISVILMLLIYVSYINIGFTISINNLIHSIFPLALSLLILGLSKNYLAFNNDLRVAEYKLSSLMESPLIISAYKNTKIENRNFNNEISLGDKESDFEIVLFMNPLCNRCKKVLTNLPRLFSQFEEQVYLRILYSGPEEDKAISKLMFAEMQQQLSDFDNDIDKLSFLKDVKQNTNNLIKDKKYEKELLSSLTEQYHWSNELNIEGTPAIIINDIIQPSFFGVEEICNLLIKINK